MCERHVEAFVNAKALNVSWQMNLLKSYDTPIISYIHK